MRTISRLIAILTILALGVASVSTTPISGASANAIVAMADMDCCPAGNTPMPDCQKDCPYLALCAAKCAPGAMVSDFQVLFFQVSFVQIRFVHGSDHAGQLIRPPAPPPRIWDMADA